MHQSDDKQLQCVNFAHAAAKRQAGQALNLKEFAVLAGVSYSVVREWVSLSGFPRFQGVIFWQDFEEWRKQEVQKRSRLQLHAVSSPAQCHDSAAVTTLPARAARLLAEAKK